MEEQFSVIVILACEHVSTVYTGPYLSAWIEWASLVEEHPIPIDTVLLTRSCFNPNDLYQMSDLLQNSDILEIG